MASNVVDEEAVERAGETDDTEEAAPGKKGILRKRGQGSKEEKKKSRKPPGRFLFTSTRTQLLSGPLLSSQISVFV